jgi:hypothetical protein
VADFKVPNLCGASPEFNAIQTKFESMITNALDGLEVDASALKSTLDTDVTSLVSDLKTMLPELPELPNINLQGQLTSLSGLNIGSGQYNTLLADITTKFDSALTAGGFSLDTLVSEARSAITDGTDLCSAVPNFEVDAAGVEDATEKAIAVLQPALDSLPEKLSTLVENTNFTTAKTAVETAVKKMQTEVSTDVDVVSNTITGTVIPTTDIGAFIVSKEFIEVTFTGGIKKEITVPLKGLEKLQASINKTPQPNTSSKGFARRPNIVSEEFKTTGTLTLKHAPSKIRSVEGYSTEYKDLDSISKGKPERWVAGTKPVFIPAVDQTDNELIDLWSVNGNTITIHNTEYKWDGHPDTGIIFRISYAYFDTYDPNYVEI